MDLNQFLEKTRQQGISDEAAKAYLKDRGLLGSEEEPTQQGFSTSTTTESEERGWLNDIAHMTGVPTLLATAVSGGKSEVDLPVFGKTRTLVAPINEAVESATNKYKSGEQGLGKTLLQASLGAGYQGTKEGLATALQLASTALGGGSLLEGKAALTSAGAFKNAATGARTFAFPSFLGAVGNEMKEKNDALTSVLNILKYTVFGTITGSATSAAFPALGTKLGQSAAGQLLQKGASEFSKGVQGSILEEGAGKAANLLGRATEKVGTKLEDIGRATVGASEKVLGEGNVSGVLGSPIEGLGKLQRWATTLGKDAEEKAIAKMAARGLSDEEIKYGFENPQDAEAYKKSVDAYAGSINDILNDEYTKNLSKEARKLVEQSGTTEGHLIYDLGIKPKLTNGRYDFDTKEISNILGIMSDDIKRLAQDTGKTITRDEIMPMIMRDISKEFSGSGNAAAIKKRATEIVDNIWSEFNLAPEEGIPLDIAFDARWKQWKSAFNEFDAKDSIKGNAHRAVGEALRNAFVKQMESAGVKDIAGKMADYQNVTHLYKILESLEGQKPKTDWVDKAISRITSFAAFSHGGLLTGLASIPATDAVEKLLKDPALLTKYKLYKVELAKGGKEIPGFTKRFMDQIDTQLAERQSARATASINAPEGIFKAKPGETFSNDVFLQNKPTIDTANNELTSLEELAQQDEFYQKLKAQSGIEKQTVLRAMQEMRASGSVDGITPETRQAIVEEWAAHKPVATVSPEQKEMAMKRMVVELSGLAPKELKNTERITQSLIRGGIDEATAKEIAPSFAGQSKEGVQNLLKLINPPQITAEQAGQALAPSDFKSPSMGEIDGIPKELAERKISLQIRKQVLEDSPSAKLSKYTAKRGEWSGSLPELGSGKSKFARRGDAIIQEIIGTEGRTAYDIIDENDVRAQFEKWQRDYADIKLEEKELKQEIKDFKRNKKSPK